MMAASAPGPGGLMQPLSAKSLDFRGQYALRVDPGSLPGTHLL
jgi:hypothetical protein